MTTSAFAQTTYTVQVLNNSFNPSAIVINQGDQITWTNSAGFHNVNGSMASFPTIVESFTSGSVGKGWTYSKTFIVIGTNSYRCDPHAGGGMLGSMTVTDVLPVELTKMTVNVKDGISKLEWSAAMEDNIKPFVIQRSLNAIDFSDLNTITPNHKPSDYSYMDNMGIERNVYYRIRIEDNNNNIKYSPIRMAQNDLKISKDKLALFPNPYVDHFHIQVESMTKHEASIEVYDMIVRLMVQQKYTMTEGVNYIHLDDSEHFPKGNYTIVVKNNNKNEFLSAIVTKQ
jgi:plastocyanin